MCGGLYAPHPAVGVLDLTDGGVRRASDGQAREGTPWDQL
jgi:hypothetical protein